MDEELKEELLESDPGNDKESKRDKFVRLAEARTQKSIDMIRKLGNLSNTNFYEYSREDIEAIFGTLEKELRSAKSKFIFDDDEEIVFKLKH